jgi:DNA polymerase
METVILDFETYYNAEYSIRRMPTMQYIRDRRFRILGCGFMIGDDEPFFAENPEDVIRRIDWENTVAMAFNAAFDGAILYEKFGVAPRMWIDPMLIARWAVAQGHLPPETTTSLSALARVVGATKGDTAQAVSAGGRELAEYCINDIEVTYDIYKYLMQFHPPGEELAFMDMHIRMAAEPTMFLDEGILSEAAKTTVESEEVHRLLRKDANFAKILMKLGVDIAYKTTPAGKTKPAFAKTDDFMQYLLNHDDPQIAMLAELRLSSTSNILRTRARRMLDVGSPFPAPLLFYGSHTGRSSGADGINVQNLPRKGPLRKALIAPDGWSFVVGDSKQIEARTVGWLAGDHALLEMFRAADPYRVFGGRYIYGCAPEELTKDQRQVAKSAVLGLGFGQGVQGFINYCARNGLQISHETAIAAVNAYRGGFPEVPRLWKRLEREVLSHGEIVLPSGRKITYPGLQEGEDGWEFRRHAIFSRGKSDAVRIWHGVACENAVQGTARDVLFWQAAMYRREGYRVVLLVHDEIVSLVPDDKAEEAAERLLHWLRTPPPWADGLSVDGEVGIGKSYADAK